MTTSPEPISPAIPRFPIVREQLASWRLMSDKKEWHLLWRREVRRLRKENRGFRHRMYTGISFVILGIVSGSFSTTPYQIPALTSFLVCMGTAYGLGRVNMRIIDNAIYQRVKATLNNGFPDC